MFGPPLVGQVLAIALLAQLLDSAQLPVGIDDRVTQVFDFRRQLSVLAVERGDVLSLRRFELAGGAQCCHVEPAWHDHGSAALPMLANSFFDRGLFGGHLT